MRIWTDAWRKADTKTFKTIYANQALIFPPKKPMVKGNESILEFMRGGMSKMDVVFEEESLTIGISLAFEVGIFKDLEPGTQNLIGSGNYSVTWILVEKEWKILCHTWSSLSEISRA